jgi:hypothetical protein
MRSTGAAWNYPIASGLRGLGATVRERLEELNRALGRLVFRFFGLGCALIAIACGYAAWWELARGAPNSWVPPVLFALGALAAASCVPYCFSGKRTLDEALDAMEGGVGDSNRWATRKDEKRERRS